jgi:cell division protein FtsB
MKKHLQIFSFSLLIILILFSFLKEDGILDNKQEKRKYITLLQEKSILQDSLQTLKTNNQLLKTNNTYIEKIAREKYFYAYPNETIIY